MMMMMATGSAYGTVVSTGGGKYDVRDWLSVAGNGETKFLEKIWTGKTIAKNRKHEWRNMSLRSQENVALVNAITNSATSIVVSGGTNSPKDIQIGRTLLLINNEYVLPTAQTAQDATTTTYTVTRGVSGTTAVAQTASTEIGLMGSKTQERYIFTGDDQHFPFAELNYCQMFEGSLEFTYSAKNSETFGDVNKSKTQIDLVMGRIKKKMQRSALYGIASADSNEDNRLMGGIKYYYDKYGKTQPAVNGVITQDLIDQEIMRYFSDSGNMKQLTIVTSIQQQKRLNAILKQSMVQQGGMGNKEHTRDAFVSNYMFGSDLGVEIIFSSSCKAGDMFFCDLSKTRMGYMEGMHLQMEKQPVNGTFDLYGIYGEVTLELDNAREVGSLLTGLTP